MKLPNTTRLIAVVSLLALTACGSSLKLGDMDSAKHAMELAVQCKTDAALSASQTASKSGGLGGAMGDIERLVILREAGRNAQADATRSELLGKPGSSSPAELDKTTAQGVQQIRADRAKRTGKQNC